tara:strand:+ start:1312 stop:1533 length:222 start_codon:yes stop_codon:yes gene_type:complete
MKTKERAVETVKNLTQTISKMKGDVVQGKDFTLKTYSSDTKNIFVKPTAQKSKLISLRNKIIKKYKLEKLEQC